MSDNILEIIMLNNFRPVHNMLLSLVIPLFYAIVTKLC